MTSSPPHRDTIAARVEKLERDLRDLDQARADVEAQLSEAREALARADSRPATPTAPARPSARLTPEQKISLFRSVFRGREDVYPTRFVSVPQPVYHHLARVIAACFGIARRWREQLMASLAAAAAPVAP